MSSSTRPPDAARAQSPAGNPHRGETWLKIVLVAGYLVCSHLASALHDVHCAVLALADIALIALLRPLLDRSAAAWAALAASAVAIALLARAGHASAPLFLVPVALIGGVAWVFARSLRGVPLITRMVAGLEGVPAASVSADLLRYTRNLTRSWAALLAGLALLNLLLALCAVPDGLLASYGVAPPWPVRSLAWSWFGGLFNLAVMAGFFLVEFAVRQRRFPGRYRNLLDFLRCLSRLGPAFWRDVAR